MRFSVTAGRLARNLFAYSARGTDGVYVDTQLNGEALPTAGRFGSKLCRRTVTMPLRLVCRNDLPGTSPRTLTCKPYGGNAGFAHLPNRL
jgi:hypothetical protein